MPVLSHWPDRSKPFACANSQVIAYVRDRFGIAQQPTCDTEAAWSTAVSKTTATGPVVSPQTSRLDPIVTSLGKVGGGGYSSGTLDAQRETNRLTGETNRLLKDMGRSIGNLGGTGRAAFG
jgi:hypothetical protein